MSHKPVADSGAVQIGLALTAVGFFVQQGMSTALVGDNLIGPMTFSFAAIATILLFFLYVGEEIAPLVVNREKGWCVVLVVIAHSMNFGALGSVLISVIRSMM